MLTNPYIDDILHQPDALRQALDQYPSHKIEHLRDRLAAGEFNRIILTGMGSSYNCAYPPYIKLTHLPSPVLLVNGSELLHSCGGLIDGNTLLWMNSQSGWSAEIVGLLQMVADRRPACLLAMTNDLSSPLGQQADLAIPIQAGVENAVGTKTYLNMLALCCLAADQLAGGAWQALRQVMFGAAEAIEKYLESWPSRVDAIDQTLGEVNHLLILGRGASLGNVWNGALNCKEAAKYPCEGMHAADFRHGPMELVEAGLAALVLEGNPPTARLNQALAREIIALGGRAYWLAAAPDDGLPTIRLPQVVDESVRMLVEVLPIQLLTLALARRAGLEAGKFRHNQKITDRE